MLEMFADEQQEQWTNTKNKFVYRQIRSLKYIFGKSQIIYQVYMRGEKMVINYSNSLVSSFNDILTFVDY